MNKRGMLVACACVTMLVAACNQFPGYTGTPRSPEFAAPSTIQSPDGFRTAVCPPAFCMTPAWRGYRDLGDVDPTSEAAFARLARNFGAAYLDEPSDAVEVSIVYPFRHEAKEFGIRSLLTQRRTLQSFSRLVALVESKRRTSQVYVNVVYQALNGAGKIYVSTGSSERESGLNMSFAGTARL